MPQNPLDLDALLSESDSLLSSSVDSILGESSSLLHQTATPQPDEYKALTPWAGPNRMKELTPFERSIVRKSEPYKANPRSYEEPIPAPAAPPLPPSPESVTPKPSMLTRFGMSALDAGSAVNNAANAAIGNPMAEAANAVTRGIYQIPPQLADFVSAIMSQPAVGNEYGPADQGTPSLGSAGGPVQHFLDEFSQTFRGAANAPELQSKNPDVAGGDPLEDPSLLAQPAWWVNNIGEGAGSMGAFLALSALTGGGSDVAGAEKAATFLGRAKQYLAATRGLSTASAFEAVTEAGGQYRDALDHGATVDQAAQVAAKSFAEQFALLMATAVPGYAFAGEAKTALGAGVRGAAGEGVQETGQTLIENRDAATYDPQRPLGQGVIGSGIAGAVLGAGGGAVEHGAVAHAQQEAAAAKQLDDIIAEADRVLNSEDGLAGGVSSVDHPPQGQGGNGHPDVEVPPSVTGEPGGPVGHGPTITPPPVPVTPIAPPSVNANLTPETITSLQGQGVPDHVIRGIADEDEAGFILGQARQQNEKPRAPVRPKQSFPQTPGLQGYLGADQHVQGEVAADRILSDLEGPVDHSNPKAADYTEPHVTEGPEIQGEDAGAGPAGNRAEDGIPDSYPGRRTGPRGGVYPEGPDERQQRRTEHYDAVFSHVLEAARQLRPEVDEAQLRAEFNDRVDLLDEMEAARHEDGREPHTLLRAIADAGGIWWEKRTGGLKGEIELLKDGQPFGSAAGINGVFREDGLTPDGMVQALREDGRFNHIEDINALLREMDDAVRAGAPETQSVFPGTAELRKRTGVDTSKVWWNDYLPQQDEDAHIDESPTNEGDVSFSPADLDNVVAEADTILKSEPPAAAPPVVEAVADVPDIAGLDDALSGLDDILSPKERKGAVPVKARAMAVGIDPKVLAGVIGVFEKLSAGGIHDFEKAIHLLAAKRGDEFVQQLAPALGKAWDYVRRLNPKMSQSGDVGAILAARNNNGRTEGRAGGPGAPVETDEPAGADGRGTGPGSAEHPADGEVSGGPGADVVAGEPETVLRGTDGAAPEAAPTIEQQRDAAARSERIAPYARRTDIRGSEHPKLIVEARALAGVPYPKLTERFQSPAAREAVAQGRVSVEQAEQALAAVQANVGEAGRRYSGERMPSGLPKGYVWNVRYDVTKPVGIDLHTGTADKMGGKISNIELAVDERNERGLERAQQVMISRAERHATHDGSIGGPDRPGHGYLIADAVGVGKSRELALTMLELMHRAKAEGRDQRLLFVTKSAKNIEDFIERELPYVASGFTKSGHDLATQDELDAPKGQPGTVPFDIVTVTEHKGAKKGTAQLPKKSHAVYVIDSIANLAPYSPALANLGLHGIIGDEAHTLKNKKANKGAAWQLLHAMIYRDTPRNQQVFVYSTATPAQDVQDFEYLYGLRLWPIDDFATWLHIITGKADERTANAFLDYVEKGGSDLDSIITTTQQGKRAGRTVNTFISEAEAEQIPRELKALGRMSARDLLRNAEYVIHKAELSPAAERRYNKYVALVNDILVAAKQFGTPDPRNLRGQLTFAGKRMQLDPVLAEAIEVGKKHVEKGYQVVFSLIHRKGVDDLGSGGNLGASINMIKETRNVNGHEVPIPGAREAKERLREKARELGPLRAPIDMITEAFGESQVAELVGGMTDDQKAAVRQFQAGKRAVIMITAAGSTGVNLQQRFLTGKGIAQGRRLMIPVQTEWSATNEMQRIGRVDRADSVMPPKWMPVSFGTPLEQRFWQSIIDRMRSMGAMSRGGDSAVADNISELGGDDAGSEITHEALREAWKKAPDDLKALFKGESDEFNDATGPRAELPPAVGMKDIQDALTLMPVRRANQFWNIYVQERDRLVREQSAGDSSKTAHYSGRVLRSIELGKNLTLHQLIDDNGHKFGMLQGVVTPHMPRLREAISDANGRPRRKYGVFKTTKGELLAGLDVLWSRIHDVAATFGKDLTRWDTYLLDEVRNKLDADNPVTLGVKNDQGANLSLKKVGDRIDVRGATMKLRTGLTAAGAIYNVKSTRWELPEAKLQQFLSAFPPLGQYKNNLPRGTYNAAVRGAVHGGGSSFLDMPRPTGVPVTPVPKKGEQMSPREIVEHLEKALDIPIRDKGFQHKRGTGIVWGLYYVKPEVVRTHIALDLPVIAHEVGHHIADKLLGLNLKDPRWAGELVRIGATTTMPSYNLEQKVNEGAAEFTRHWMVDPRYAFRMAPTFTLAWEEAMQTKHPELWTALKFVQSQVQGVVELEDAERARLEIDMDADTPTNDKRTWFERFEYEVVDDLARLRHAVTDMARGVSLHITENAYTLARLARGHAAKASGFMRHGVRDNAGQFTSTSLVNILAPVRKHIDDFAVYLVAKRAVELHARRNKDGSPAINEQAMTREKAVAAVAKFESPEFIKAAEGLYAFQDALLDYAVENGAVSQPAADAMRKLNQYYVPFQRVMDAWASAYGGATSDKLADRTPPYKRIKGSGKQIINPLESIVKNTHVLVNMVEHNRAMLALANLADAAEGSGKWLVKMKTPRVPVTFKMSQIEADIRAELSKNGIDVPGDIDLRGTATVWVPPAFANHGKRLVTVMRNGKRVFYEVNDKALFDSILAMGPMTMNPILRLMLVKPTALLRRSVTLTLGFIARNPIRDNWTAMVQSKYGFVPGVDFVAGLYHVIGKTELYQQFLTSGGAQSALASMQRETVRKEIRSLAGLKAEKFTERLHDTVMTPIDVLAAMSELMENATRVGEFRLAVNARGSERSAWGRVMGAPMGQLSTEETLSRAALAARDVTVDFQRAGRSVRNVNQWSAFFNARVQGAARMVETFKDKPVQSAMTVAPIAMLSAVLWALNHDDDRYRELPEWEKNQYWHFPAPWNESGFIRMPKPQEYGAIFGNTIEAALDFAKKEDPKAIDRMVSQLLMGAQGEDWRSRAANMAVSLIPTAVLPWMEVLTNYDTFRDRNIVSPWEQHERKWLEYNRWTSQTARKLGRLMDVSPAKLEHLVYGYTGNMGKGGFMLGDAVLHSLGMTPAMPGGGLTGMPLVGAFYSEGGRSGSAESLRRLYEKDTTLTGIRGDMDDLAVLGEFTERAALVKENPDLVQFTGATELNRKTGKAQPQAAFNPTIGQAVRAIRELRGDTDAIFANASLTALQKREAMDKVYDRMVDIARMGLGGQPMRPRHGRVPVAAR